MKEHVSDLALLGGPPAFEQTLHVGRPNLGNREKFLSRLNDILERRWFTNAGPYVQKFEKRVAEYLGVRHCIAMCNGTIALEIAIRALGLKGEAIVPSFTFIATAHALQWQEITPIFSDVDPQMHTLDPAHVEAMITPRTTGILATHLWGQPCDIAALQHIAERKNLKLLFDASHAFGTTYKGKMVGNFGDVEIFSFHATKFINTFEGGAVVTNNDELARKVRLMKNFGFSGFDKVIYIGTNGKMNEVSAAMGLTSMESIDEFIESNRLNYEEYQKGLAGIPGLRLLSYDKSEKRNYQYVVVEINEEVIKISRDLLIKILHRENVIARRYFYPGCHRMEPYRSYIFNANLALPVTDRICKSVIVLPTGMSIGVSGVLKICKLIRFCIENSQQIKTLAKKS